MGVDTKRKLGVGNTFYFLFKQPVELHILVLFLFTRNLALDSTSSKNKHRNNKMCHLYKLYHCLFYEDFEVPGKA